MTDEEILEKIIKQSQMTALIANVETKAISAKELIEDLKTYQVWMETQWEKYYQSEKLNMALQIMNINKDSKINELTKEIKKLNAILNDNG